MRGQLDKTIQCLPRKHDQLLQMVTDTGLVIQWDALISDTVNAADKPTAAVARFLENHPELRPFEVGSLLMYAFVYLIMSSALDSPLIAYPRTYRQSRAASTKRPFSFSLTRSWTC